MQLGGISETTKNNKKLIIRSRFFGKFGSQIRNFSFGFELQGDIHFCDILDLSCIFAACNCKIALVP